MILSGKVAIVTGGTGALGGAVVDALLSAGAVVAVPYRHAGELEALRERLGRTGDAALSGAQVDLTDEQGVRAYYDQVAAPSGGLDDRRNRRAGWRGG